MGLNLQIGQKISIIGVSEQYTVLMKMGIRY